MIYERPPRVGAGPYALAIMDASGDGRPDLVVANSLDQTVSILVNLGGGSFSPPVDFAVPLAPADFAVGRLLVAADTNEDGLTDLLVAETRRQELYWLEAAAAPVGFFASRRVAAGVGGGGMDVGDLDRDGHLDLVVAERFRDRLQILRGNGIGRFTATSVLATPRDPVAVLVFDANRDGLPDIAVACRESATVSVWLGAPGGGFRPRADIDVGAAFSRTPSSITAGEATGDPWPDLLVASERTDEVLLLAGSSSGTYRLERALPTGGGPLDAVLHDMNGDGLADILSVDSFTDTVTTLVNVGGGLFVPAQDDTVPTGTTPVALAVADLTADGRPDIVTANLDGDTLSLIANATPYPIRAGDLTGDGSVDTADLVLLVGELFDGDDPRAFAASEGWRASPPTADGNADGRITAADLIVLRRTNAERKEGDGTVRP